MTNESKLLHHLEQIEASRRDFKNLWGSNLRLVASSWGMRDRRHLDICRDVAWKAFLAGQKSNKTP